MKPHQSIRWLLMLWNMALLAIVLITLLSLHYHLQRKSRIAQIDTALQDALMETLPLLSRPKSNTRLPQSRQGQPGMDGPRRRDLQGPRGMGGPPHRNFQDRQPEMDGPPQDSSLQDDAAKKFLESVEDEGLYIVSWDPEGTRAHQFGNAPAVQAATYSAARQEKNYITRNEFRELVTRHPSGTLVVIGHSMEELNQQLKLTRGYLILVGCFIFLLGYSGGRCIIGKALQPIRQISKTADEIADGDHSRRIELSAAPAELSSLAQTLNDSFDYLDSALENQKRFSADASHELRTPIAVVMAQTQAALKRDRSTEEYKTVLAACQRAGERMKIMADSLLDLTRIDGHEIALTKEMKDLNEVVSFAASDAAHLSERHPVEFLAADETFMAKIDQPRLHQVLMNLMTNAIRHNPEGCAIHVSLKQERDEAVIRVADNGLGIPPEALPHIFDRFFRVDKSRSREQGGAGLGLSIVRSLVEAHGGSIQASSVESEGAIFTIRLPR